MRGRGFVVINWLEIITAIQKAMAEGQYVSKGLCHVVSPYFG